jgi:hypothetical protein
MVIPFSNCAKEEWQIMHMCWLLKIGCLNKEGSNSFSLFGLNSGFSGWAWNVFIYGWLQWL